MTGRLRASPYFRATAPPSASPSTFAALSAARVSPVIGPSCSSRAALSAAVAVTMYNDANAPSTHDTFTSAPGMSSGPSSTIAGGLPVHVAMVASGTLTRPRNTSPANTSTPKKLACAACTEAAT